MDLIGLLVIVALVLANRGARDEYAYGRYRQ
jgi:hypothetical protein